MLVKIKRKSPTNKDSKAPVSNILTEKLDKEYVQNNLSTMTTEQSTSHETGSVGTKRRATTDLSCLDMSQNSALSQKVQNIIPDDSAMIEYELNQKWKQIALEVAKINEDTMELIQ